MAQSNAQRNAWREGLHRVEATLDAAEFQRLKELAEQHDRTHSKTIAALIMGRIKA